MIETSAEITELTAALIKFQGRVGGVLRDAQNPHFRNRYATLENVIDTAKPALQEAGLAFTQAPGQIVDNAVEVTTMLVHTSGQWMRSTLHVPLGKRDAQGVGSAITYGCRYSLMATLGLPPTDDDGEAAIDRDGFRPAPDKPLNLPKPKASSSQLKKDEIWAEFTRELEEASLVKLPGLAAAWASIAERDNWPQAWRDAAREEVNKRRVALKQASVVDEVLDTFPGSHVVAETSHQRPL